MRRDIDQKSHKLRSVLLDPAMRKEFLGGIPKDEKKAIKAFVEQNKENALKTKPKVGLQKSFEWRLGVDVLGRASGPKKASYFRLDAIRDASPDFIPLFRP